MPESLQKAITHVLGPLVRFLIRQGVSHAEFMDWSKQAYVTEAVKHAGIRGKSPSISRIAIVTGINRKEVKRLRELDSDVATRASSHNRAIRVITGWLQDSEFHDQNNAPRPLTYGDQNDSFNRLVKRYGGDVPAKALLDELVHVGTVSLEENTVNLMHHGYVPRENQSAMWDMYATSAADLLNTLYANCHEGKRRFQMSVAYDEVTSEGRDQFRQLSRDEAMKLLKLLNNELSKFDRGTTSTASGEGSHRVGLGIYWIEDDEEEHHANR